MNPFATYTGAGLMLAHNLVTTQVELDGYLVRRILGVLRGIAGRSLYRKPATSEARIGPTHIPSTHPRGKTGGIGDQVACAKLPGKPMANPTTNPKLDGGNRTWPEGCS